MFGRHDRETITSLAASITSLGVALADQGARLSSLEAGLARLAEKAACAQSPSAAAGPIIQIRTMGNIANRMIQYMAGFALAQRIPGARLTGIDLPEWGIVAPQIDVPEPVLRIPSHRIDVARTLSLLSSGMFAHVILLQYLQNVANFLPPDAYRAAFPRSRTPLHVFGSDVLLISLRMGEVLTGYYPLYTLLPVGFYRELVDRTGLEPVFFGQLTPSPYLEALKHAFPRARFIAGTEPMEDFEVLRSARNLCLSVSTFAWAAGYLGEASRIIIPVTGLFSPAACGCLGEDIDLVPRGDARYECWLFPINYAVPEMRCLDALAALEGRWQRVEHASVLAMLDGAAMLPRDIDAYLALFDDDHYLRTHAEVADAVRDGRISSGRQHYLLHGFDENRSCFPLDHAWYATAYPESATAIGFGRYRDFHHFHAASGAASGYAPLGIRIADELAA